MSTEQHQVRLIVERANGEMPPRASCTQPAPGVTALVLPPGPAWIWPCPGGPPKVAAARPAEAERAVILEQVVQHRQPRLLLVRAGTGQVRVNGLPVPHFILLKEKDCLRLDEEFLLHITVYLQPMIGLASAECVGKECPVCRVPFAAASKCYFCPCGAAMHCEDSGTEESLQCAELCARSGCPACQRPVALTCGYSYMPEGIHE